MYFACVENSKPLISSKSPCESAVILFPPMSYNFLLQKNTTSTNRTPKTSRGPCHPAFRPKYLIAAAWLRIGEIVFLCGQRLSHLSPGNKISRTPSLSYVASIGRNMLKKNHLLGFQLSYLSYFSGLEVCVVRWAAHV